MAAYAGRGRDNDQNGKSSQIEAKHEKSTDIKEIENIMGVYDVFQKFPKVIRFGKCLSAKGCVLNQAGRHKHNVN